MRAPNWLLGQRRAGGERGDQGSHPHPAMGRCRFHNSIQTPHSCPHGSPQTGSCGDSEASIELCKSTVICGQLHIYRYTCVSMQSSNDCSQLWCKVVTVALLQLLRNVFTNSLTNSVYICLRRGGKDTVPYWANFCWCKSERKRESIAFEFTKELTCIWALCNCERLASSPIEGGLIKDFTSPTLSY